MTPTYFYYINKTIHNVILYLYFISSKCFLTILVNNIVVHELMWTIQVWIPDFYHFLSSILIKTTNEINM